MHCSEKQENKQKLWLGIRNRVVKSLRIGKQLYLNKLAHVDLKHFWKYVKFLNKNKETVPTLQQGVYTASNDKEKAEMFNNFFAI